MANVRNWRDVRAEALRTGRISEEGVAAARRQHDEHERSWRLGGAAGGVVVCAGQRRPASRRAT